MSSRNDKNAMIHAIKFCEIISFENMLKIAGHERKIYANPSKHHRVASGICSAGAGQILLVHTRIPNIAYKELRPASHGALICFPRS